MKPSICTQSKIYVDLATEHILCSRTDLQHTVKKLSIHKIALKKYTTQ